jgi:hypothetical protein
MEWAGTEAARGVWFGPREELSWSAYCASP